MQRLGGPQYLPPGQDVPGASFAYRPSPRALAAQQMGQQPQEASIGQGALDAGATGASIGTSINPGLGTAIGAGIGALSGAAGAALQDGSEPDSWQSYIGQFLQGKGPAAGVAKQGLSMYKPSPKTGG